MPIDLASNETSYKKVRTVLRDRLNDGHWAQGQILPGRRELAREFGVSVATIERAMLPLLTEGVLRSDGRRGTYVGRPAGFISSRPATAQVRDSLVAGSVGIVASVPRKLYTSFQQDEYWTRMMIDAIERVLTDAGLNPVLVNRIPIGSSMPEPLADSFAAALGQNLSALVLLCLDRAVEDLDSALGTLASSELPIVCVSPAELSRPVRHVLSDDYRAGYKVAEHLLDLGHREITVFSPFRAEWSEQRLRGIQSAVQHRNLSDDAVVVMRGKDEPWQFDAPQFPFTHAAVSKARAEGWNFGGAVIAIQDIVSFGLLYESCAQGLVPGRDYALIGFDDHPTSRQCGLSSIRPPLEAMAREAAKIVLNSMEGRPTGIVTKLQGELVVRSSTAASGMTCLTPNDYRQILQDELGYDRWEQECPQR